MIFSIKDSLRQAVEAASGGLNTVLYTKKGQPIFARVIPKFRVETLHSSLGSGVHPAFIVGGREVSEIWIGMYPSHIANGEAVSVPGVPPSTTDFNTWVLATRNMGPGLHLLTNAEWAAMALLSIYAIGNGNDPVSGPDPYGRDRTNPALFGRRSDGKVPGDTSSISFMITGSGPLSWRHDRSPFGIADVSLGISPGYLVAGLALVNGEIRIVPDNDAALPNVDLSPSGPAWRAIMPDGSLVAPGTAGTLKYDIPPAASYSDNGVADNLGTPTLRTQVRSAPASWGDRDHDFALATGSINLDPSNLTVPPILRALALIPLTSNATIGVRPYGTRLAGRGYLGVGSVSIWTNPSFYQPAYVAYVPI